MFRNFAVAPQLQKFQLKIIIYCSIISQVFSRPQSKTKEMLCTAEISDHRSNSDYIFVLHFLQELPTLTVHLSSPPGFQWSSCYLIFNFMSMLCRSLFVLFLLAIVLSVFDLWILIPLWYLQIPFLLKECLYIYREWMWSSGLGRWT